MQRILGIVCVALVLALVALGSSGCSSSTPPKAGTAKMDDKMKADDKMKMDDKMKTEDKMKSDKMKADDKMKTEDKM